jgi:uncharacterized protein
VALTPLLLRSAASLAMALVAAGCAGPRGAASVPPLPIIDMHMHARLADHYGAEPPPMCAPVVAMPLWDPAEPIETGLGFAGRAPCEQPIPAAASDEAVFAETVAIMERRNMFGVLGGDPSLVADWMARAPGRFYAGLDFRLDRAGGTASVATAGEAYMPPSPEDLRALHAVGRLQVFAEILNQYGGILPDDPRMTPYWTLAEELDIPVGIHLGPGGPGEFYFGNRQYRARNQSALTLEAVLVQHPRLRVYVMHAGYPFLDDLIALLFSHPHVYVEVSMLVNVEPRAGFYRYLQALVDAGYGDRIMFGSDQMVWPGLIEPGIESIERAPFLSAAEKRAILYDNAARFLRLSPAEIARHHGR